MHIYTERAMSSDSIVLQQAILIAVTVAIAYQLRSYLPPVVKLATGYRLNVGTHRASMMVRCSIVRLHRFNLAHSRPITWCISPVFTYNNVPSEVYNVREVLEAALWIAEDVADRRRKVGLRE